VRVGGRAAAVRERIALERHWQRIALHRH
jgi:hypothetical protein